MSTNDVETSFHRCEDAADFAEEFYGVFLASSPEIGELFAGTDFKKQRKLLRGTVYLMVMKSPEDEKARLALQRIGDSHSRRKLDIRPDLYEVWLDSLCQTVQRLDPEFNDALEVAWRDKMRPGIEFITSFY